MPARGGKRRVCAVALCLIFYGCDPLAEPCDPEVLHARVSVLESNDKRHDDDIKQLWKETTDLKLCAACLPTISADLKSIQSELRNLNECKIAQENEARGEGNFWANNRWWIERIFVMVMGAVVVILWESAMYFHSEGP